MESLVSVITINLNNVTGLKETVKSVLFQSYSNFELIIIDGGSNDGSIEFIKAINDSKTKFLIEQDNGIYHAMNKGISLSKSKYLMFLNSGDCFNNPTLLDYFSNNNRNEDFIYGNLFVKDNKQTHLIKYPDILTFNQFFKKSIPHSGGTFIKKELFNNNGYYNESYKIVSDWKFFIETIVLKNCTYKHLDIPFSTFNLDGISTLNDSLMINEREAVLIELFPKMIISDYKHFNSKEVNYNTETIINTINQNYFTRMLLKIIYRLSIIFNKKSNK